MLYLTSFTVTGLEDQEKAEKLKEALLQINGVKTVEISGNNRISVTYDPHKVIPSVLIAAINSVGVKAGKG